MRDLIPLFNVSKRIAAVRHNPAYPAGYAEDFGQKFKDRVSAMDIPLLITPVYAERFSIDELKQILAFRSSPIGQKLMDAQREILSQADQAAANMAQQLAFQVEKEVLAEHPDYAKQMGDAPHILEASGQTPPYRIGGDVSAPSLIQKSEPTYSPEARQAKLSGSVTLSLVIDENGTPRNIQVDRSLGMGLDEKAIETVTKWRFRPGMKDGHPVATTANVQVNFRLLDTPPQ